MSRDVIVVLIYAIVYLTSNTTKILAEILKNDWKFDQFSDQKIWRPRNSYEIKKITEKFNEYSDQNIRWPPNSYESLEMTGNGPPIVKLCLFESDKTWQV